jgi:hypothetical protein
LQIVFLSTFLNVSGGRDGFELVVFYGRPLGSEKQQAEPLVIRR